VRVLYLLFLVPLGAFASCPAGLKLSNVPISTTLPYCVKWESSTLGGCEVACPGVCVEFPNEGTKGPIETTGSECKLGGGGDGGGPGGGDGDGGTGGGDAPYDYPFKNQISPIGVGGAYQEGTTAALKQIDEDLRWFAIKNYEQGKGMLATFDGFSQNLREVTDALKTQISNNEESGKIELMVYENLNRQENILQQLTNCVVNPKGNNCEHLGGGGGSSDDTKAIVSMMSSAMSMWGSTQGNMQSVNGVLSYMHGDVSAIKGMTEGIGSSTLSQLGQINGNLSAIKDLVKNGQGSGGGSGGEGEGGGADIDYSKMPGAAGNPLNVAGATYESTLCQGDVKCFFDLGEINKKYDESKKELKESYQGIKTEVSEVFKFQFSGSASAPKCFDMFSLFGKSYSVCPDAEGYWETLAAIMMFIFYFIALMIVARR